VIHLVTSNTRRGEGVNMKKQAQMYYSTYVHLQTAEGVDMCHLHWNKAENYASIEGAQKEAELFAQEYLVANGCERIKKIKVQLEIDDGRTYYYDDEEEE
jgi:hypothetical protein